MDELDLRIIRVMGLRPYGTQPRQLGTLRPASIASQLGVSPETVKARIARLEEAGVIRGYHAYPNLRHLGLEAAGYLLQIPDPERKAEAVQAIEPVDGLLEIHDFVGPVLCLDLAHAGGAEEERKLRLLSRLTGSGPPMKLYPRRTPKVDRELDRLDWQILKHLRRDARRAPDAIAKELSVHTKTVRRRLQRMSEEGSFFAVPLLDAGRMEGLFPFILIFHTGPDIDQPTIRSILDAYDDRQVHSYVPESCELGNLSVMVFARSAAEIEEMRRRGLGLPQVLDVRSFVFQGYAEHGVWIDDAIERRIAQVN